METLISKQFERATIFEPGYLMGYRQSEVQQLGFVPATGKWGKERFAAQFVLRGKRKKQLVSAAGVVIIEGWGHPELEVWVDDCPEIIGPRVPNSLGLQMRRARYAAFSVEWDALLDDYLRRLNPAVILDGRAIQVATHASAESTPELTRPADRAATSHDRVNYPDELDESELREGAAKQVFVNEYERNEAARQRCLDYHGYICKVCDVDMASTYGELGAHYIHVHHQVPLSDIGEDYRVDPVEDLVPVCPNCHAMLHRPAELLSIEQLREIIAANRAGLA